MIHSFISNESNISIIVAMSKCSNYGNGPSEAFCHNGGSFHIMPNGTSGCVCMNEWSYGPRCEYIRNDDMTRPTPPPFPDYNSNDGNPRESSLKH